MREGIKSNNDKGNIIYEAIGVLGDLFPIVLSIYLFLFFVDSILIGTVDFLFLGFLLSIFDLNNLLIGVVVTGLASLYVYCGDMDEKRHKRIRIENFFVIVTTTIILIFILLNKLKDSGIITYLTILLVSSFIFILLLDILGGE